MKSIGSSNETKAARDNSDENARLLTTATSICDAFHAASPLEALSEYGRCVYDNNNNNNRDAILLDTRDDRIACLERLPTTTTEGQREGEGASSLSLLGLLMEKRFNRSGSVDDTNVPLGLLMKTFCSSRLCSLSLRESRPLVVNALADERNAPDKTSIIFVRRVARVKVRSFCKTDCRCHGRERRECERVEPEGKQKQRRYPFLR